MVNWREGGGLYWKKRGRRKKSKQSVEPDSSDTKRKTGLKPEFTRSENQVRKGVRVRNLPVNGKQKAGKS